MRRAMFWHRKGSGVVQCTLCPHNCIIKPGSTGVCRVRKNVNGVLYSLFYGKPSSLAVDPIEKKPFFHFLPGSEVLSFATLGCNLKCKHCQNWELSQEWSSLNLDSFLKDLSPEDIVNIALEKNIPVIAATYTEPTVFFEFMLDVFKLAKKNGLKTVIVSNGFINEKPLLKLIPFLDAANIDLKAFSNDFYLRVTSSRLQPVLDSIKLLHDNNVWVEVTNLIIPGYNDADVSSLSSWIASLDVNIPLHLTAFYPTYKLTDAPPTPVELLIKSYDVAKSSGLNFVYLGNVFSDKESTFCPNCGELLIKRSAFLVDKKGFSGVCPNCGFKLSGVWK